MKTVIITGCAGFIGNHLTRHLLNKGYRVVGIDDLSNGNLDFLPKKENFIFYQFSLLSREICDVIFEQIDKEYEPVALFHLAGNGYKELSSFARNYTYSNNLNCYSNVINQCIKYKYKIIYVSSTSLYDDSTKEIDENSTIKPNNPEDISNYAIELDIISASNEFNIDYNIVRLGETAGIYQNLNNLYKNIFTIYTYHILKYKEIPIYIYEKSKIAILDIENCLEVFEKLIEDYRNEIFNLASNNYISIEEIVKFFTKSAEKYKINFLKKYYNTIAIKPVTFFNLQKAEKTLLFKDKTNIEKTIDDIIQWAITCFKSEEKIKTIDYEFLDNTPYYFWPKKPTKNNTNIEIENKEYFEENSKRYRKSYG